MDVGEVRVAEDRDFELLKIYLQRNDGWRLEYERGDTAVWTRTPPDLNGSAFKMIRVSEEGASRVGAGARTSLGFKVTSHPPPPKEKWLVNQNNGLWR